MDGYIDGVGKTLYDNYQDYNKVKDLIKLGNIRTLGKQIEFNNSEEDTISYNRDLNEDYKINKPIITKSFEELEKILFDSWIEYVYLYDEQTNTWLWDSYISDVHNLKLTPLADYFKEQRIEKPLAAIVRADGNVFNLIGICSRALKTAGFPEKAKEMTNRITNSKSYEEALSIMCEYIEPVEQNYQRLEDLNNIEEFEIDI